MSQLLRALLASYPGVPVRFEVGVADVVLPAIKVQPGETTFRVINRACQLARVASPSRPVAGPTKKENPMRMLSCSTAAGPDRLRHRDDQ
ncbi:hypothetical protein R0381_002285 [Jeongeupia wiesaeckerbachi]|uniref:hypothetical protein n=1 Tax=Jeongeupia wiesaeckerbachi TaxID=3051218 RepID=UPI003D8082AC